jgi:hypothetical protein
LQIVNGRHYLEYLKQLKGYGVPKEELENYFSKLEPVPKTFRPKKTET